VGAVLRIRNATATEAPVLEALQRRSSDVWEAYREQLAANPDAIELPQAFIDKGWVRVAIDVDETPVGFSAVVPANGPVHELDGLFVEPDQMSAGVGRALVEDAAARVRSGCRSARGDRRARARVLRKGGFELIGVAQTRFGPAVRMRRDLQR
jgi:GNAT superfamily N-acetyltransferase